MKKTQMPITDEGINKGGMSTDAILLRRKKE